METRISATELARNAGEVLGRVRHGEESFLIERNGEPVARLTPVYAARPFTLRDLARLWESFGATDAEFAADIEAVNESDQPPEYPWD